MMNKLSELRQMCFGGIVIGLSIAALAAIIIPFWPGKALWSEEAAAWSQSLGTMFALWITQRIASSESRKRELAEAERAKSKRLGLLMSIMAANHAVSLQLRAVEVAFGHMDTAPNAATLRLCFSAMKLETPEAIPFCLQNTDCFTRAFTDIFISYAQACMNYDSSIRASLKFLDAQSDEQLNNAINSLPNSVNYRANLLGCRATSRLLAAWATQIEKACRSEISGITGIGWGPLNELPA